jgi:hypothetical protein
MFKGVALSTLATVSLFFLTIMMDTSVENYSYPTIYLPKIGFAFHFGSGRIHIEENLVWHSSKPSPEM